MVYFFIIAISSVVVLTHQRISVKEDRYVITFDRYNEKLYISFFLVITIFLTCAISLIVIYFFLQVFEWRLKKNEHTFFYLNKKLPYMNQRLRIKENKYHFLSNVNELFIGILDASRTIHSNNSLATDLVKNTNLYENHDLKSSFNLKMDKLQLQIACMVEEIKKTKSEIIDYKLNKIPFDKNKVKLFKFLMVLFEAALVFFLKIFLQLGIIKYGSNFILMIVVTYFEKKRSMYFVKHYNKSVTILKLRNSIPN